jgi:hypothetical protein
MLTNGEVVISESVLLRTASWGILNEKGEKQRREVTHIDWNKGVS